MSDTILPPARQSSQIQGSTRGILLVSLGIGTLIGAGLLLVLRPGPASAPGGTASSEVIEPPAVSEPSAGAATANPSTRVAAPPEPPTTSLELGTEVFFRMIRLSHATDGTAPARNPRSVEEATALADQILEMVRAGEATFEELAREHSDHPTSVKDGAVQRMRLGQLPPPMRDALVGVAEGVPVVAPIPGENALFVLVRRPLPPTLAAQQILIRTSETSLGGPADDRSREDALLLAQQLVEQALEDDADFDAMVAELSEDPGKFRGGKIGPFPAEMMPQEFSDAVAGVEEWQVVGEPVRNDLGYLVLRRIPLEETEPPVPPDDPVPAPTSEPDPLRVPLAGGGEPIGTRAVGFEILITYEGAAAANLRVKRSRADAEARARAIVALARAKGQEFLELVERYSEDRGLATSGGSLGMLLIDRRVHAGHDAVFALEPLQVSDPFESDRGFHVFRRLALEEVGLRDILVTYGGAKNASPKLERTREEARVTAESALARLESGESFAAVARTVSDQRRASGGALGALYRQHPFFSQFPGHLERAYELEIGQHSGVFESDWGFHLVTREHVLRARHLRIAYQGTTAAPLAARQRSRVEAEKLMEQVLTEIAAGRDFREVVIERSEDPDARRGGDLGVFGPGRWDDTLFAAVAALEPGQISGVIETRFGLELVQRLPLGE